ncbi:hypothetical protein FRC08_015217 [Ceratobasidium sp. 394]|nr:hypothetical protein FRC08_015217 [Ceratobasidium sp. 394]
MIDVQNTSVGNPPLGGIHDLAPVTTDPLAPNPNTSHPGIHLPQNQGNALPTFLGEQGGLPVLPPPTAVVTHQIPSMEELLRCWNISHPDNPASLSAHLLPYLGNPGLAPLHLPPLAHQPVCPAGPGSGSSAHPGATHAPTTTSTGSPTTPGTSTGAMPPPPTYSAYSRGLLGRPTFGSAVRSKDMLTADPLPFASRAPSQASRAPQHSMPARADLL